MSRPVAVPTVVLALGSAWALAACGSSASSTSAPAKTSSTSPARSSTDPAPAPASFRSGSGTTARGGPVVKTHPSRYGKVLFDRAGRGLYLFATDPTKPSTSYGA